MNALPSMIVLDFCEWLKNHIKKPRDENHIDMLDLILDNEYSSNLKQLAKEYLQDGKISMRNLFALRNLFHRFIDSDEFTDCCKHCDPVFIEEWKNKRQINREDFFRLWDQYFYCLHWYSSVRDAFHHFIIRNYEDDRLNEYFYNDSITPEMLAESTKFYFKYQKDEPFVTKMMTGFNADLSLEIDFLEWLAQNKKRPMNLGKMPITVFENIAEEYCDFAERPVDDSKKLIKAFKQSDMDSLGKKLVAVLTRSQSEKFKSLGYIYDRYVDENIPFRCFFLPLASDGNDYKNFINKYWSDLHALSGDHLDIYYSEEDFGKSGYAIKNDIKMLSKDLPEQLPCLIIWQDNLQSAQAIDILGLTDQDIVRLIEKIVDLIKKGNTLDNISQEAKEMAKQIRQEHIDAQRPTSYTTFNIENNTGTVIGYMKDSNITVYTGLITNEKFEIETQEAIKIINSFHEVERIYRDNLISLIKEANVAIQNDDEKSKIKCRSKFEGFMLGAGKVVGTIITKLSEMATIAGFFGIAINTLNP